MTCVHTSPCLDSHISRVLAAALADIERARHVGLIVAICPMCSHQMFSSRRHLDVSVYLGDVHVDQWCTISAEGDLGRLPTQWASPTSESTSRVRDAETSYLHASSIQHGTHRPPFAVPLGRGPANPTLIIVALSK